MFHRTQLLLDRADAFEKAGQWHSAIELCEDLFASSWREGRIEDLLEALLRIGLLYSTRGEGGIAADYFHLSYEISHRTGDLARSARSLNSLGVQNQRFGDLDGAKEAFLKARDLARQASDNRTRGDIEVNLGIVSNIRGDLYDALAHYRAALTEYQQIEHKQRVARVLNNLGMLYIDLADHNNASQTLGQALDICRDIGDVQVEGIVQANRTELLLAIGDLGGARLSCDEAFEIASKLGNSTLKADVLKSYGAIYRETGKPHLAELHFNQAISLAAELDYPLIEADANRELALVLLQSDRNKEALQALNRAHSLFASLQAKHEQADIDKRFKQLEEDFLSLVARWGDSIEAKDQYTRGHCQRVAEYACELALRAGLPERDLVWFRMGAFLHDVGKTEVPAEILNKPGRLSEEERTIMELHTVAGDQILAMIQFPWDVRPMVRSHHERWDGRGYPDQLVAEQIPLSARILHVADVFDALTTTRSYRKPLSPSEAYQLMVSDHGSFDPELLALFGDLIPLLLPEPTPSRPD